MLPCTRVQLTLRIIVAMYFMAVDGRWCPARLQSRLTVPYNPCISSPPASKQVLTRTCVQACQQVTRASVLALKHNYITTTNMKRKKHTVNTISKKKPHCIKQSSADGPMQEPLLLLC
jgi:hypothetical protein